VWLRTLVVIYSQLGRFSRWLAAKHDVDWEWIVWIQLLAKSPTRLAQIGNEKNRPESIDQLLVGGGVRGLTAAHIGEPYCCSAEYEKRNNIRGFW
ncbi:MAG TPA: hypothetical protein VF872_04735, partial [Gaiellaceae bacterium]